MHSNGLAHRDVKSENILLLNDSKSCDEVKLSDFGLSCNIDPEIGGIK